MHVLLLTFTGILFAIFLSALSEWLSLGHGDALWLGPCRRGDHAVSY